MSWLGDQISDLNYYCSKENTDKKLRSTYRQLRMVWIFTILFTVIVPVFWVMRLAFKVNLPLVMCIIITALWALMLAFSIYSFIQATKE